MAESKKKELSLESLDEVNGGRIKLTGYALLTAFIAMVKQQGYSKEEGIEMFTDGWNEGCEFKSRFTDATDEDFQKAINFLKNNWF